MNIGNIDDLKTASADRVSITIVNKSFDGKIIDDLNLENSIIAKSSFKDVKLYNSKFSNCEFTKDDFNGSTLSILEFDACQFHAVDFTNCKMKNVSFNNDCKFINCTFSGVDMTDNVIGLSDKELNVIAEQNDNAFDLFKECGFEKKEDGSFERLEGKFTVALAEDPEKGENIWDMMFFNDADNCLFTQNFTLDDRLTKSYFEEMVQYGLRTVISK